MANVFTGWQTGRISWLVEVDYLDGLRTWPLTGRGREIATYLAANVYVAKGHNLKLNWQIYDPDLELAEDHRDRIGILWEYSPVQFTQLRLGYNLNSGIPQNDMQNAEQVFLEIHIFF